MQTEGKKHSTNKKQKVQASEMIMLMMTQGHKKKKELVWLVIVKQEMGLEGAQGLPHARLCQLS